MQFWLDTVNLEAVKRAVNAGIIAGITTNPSILARATNIPETLRQLLNLQQGPVAVQVTGQTAKEMVAEGRQIAAFSDRMIVKIPVNHEGLSAIKQLCADGIQVLGTGVSHPTQALLAANVGAAYIAPYYCHIGTPTEAKETLKNIKEILSVNAMKTKILVASLRQLEDIVFCALLGVEAVTIKENLLDLLLAEQPVLEKFSHVFQADWKQAHGNVSIKDVLAAENVGFFDAEAQSRRESAESTRKR